MNRYMLDIEAFGGGDKTAMVVQLGACNFEKTLLFCVNIDARDAQKNGAIADADTIYWWLKQDDHARMSIGRIGETEFNAFTQLNEFLSHADEIWSHATYDFVVVMAIMKRLEIKPKFRYTAARDIRTLLAISGLEKDKNEVRTGVHHNALDDCLYQVDYCKKAFERMIK